MPEIVPATREMLMQFYGKLPAPTVRAMAAVDGDVVLGVTGFYPDCGRMVLFAKMADDLRQARHARTILTTGRRVLAMARSFGMPVQAIADTEVEGSERLIRHLGGERVHREIYQWT